MTRTFRIVLVVSILSVIGCNKNQKVIIVQNDSLSVEKDQRAEITRKDSITLTYTHTALGLSFDFSEWEYVPPKLVQSTDDWSLFTDQKNALSFGCPRNVSVTYGLRESDFDNKRDSATIIDFGGGAGVKLYTTTLDKDSIFYEWGFEQTPIDREGSYRSDFEDDSTGGVDTVWTSSGRQGMLQTATVIEGIDWYGLRSVNFTGIYYTEAYAKENEMSGYAGLAEFLQIIMIHKKKSNGTYRVAVYYEYPSDVMTEEESSRVPPRLYGEEAFYEILASMKLQ